MYELYHRCYNARMVTLRIDRPEEMVEVVHEVLARGTAHDYKRAFVVALSGDLGAGKTTFTQALARELGVMETVVSPTFVVMKIYETGGGRGAKKAEPFSRLIHLDAYRVEDLDEMRVLRFPELVAQNNTIICIEWPEKIADLIPSDALRLTFAIEGETRIVTIT